MNAFFIFWYKYRRTLIVSVLCSGLLMTRTCLTTALWSSELSFLVSWLLLPLRGDLSLPYADMFRLRGLLQLSVSEGGTMHLRWVDVAGGGGLLLVGE